MGAEAELFTAAEEEASMAVEVSIAEAGSLAMAAPTAPDLLAEEVTVAKEVTAEAADLNLGAIKAHPQRGRRLVIRRIFVPPSTMVSGIRSSTLLIQPVQARDAIPQVLKAHASWRTALALPIPAGALLAQHEARPVWSADPPGERRPSVGAEMVGEAIGIAIGTVGGAGEVGASPSVRGRLLEPVLGVRLESLVVRPVLVCPGASLQLLSRIRLLFRLRLRLVRQSASVPARLVSEFV
jgi:hypothetical protein